jgi:hypothetical protein
MSDDELNAKFEMIARNVNATFWALLVAVIGCSMMLTAVCCATTAHAASTPKPTPAVTNTWCVNQTTGSTRIVLNKNGKIQYCRKTEQQVTIINLDSAPSPAATATPIGDPTPTATASVAPTPDPTATATSTPSAQDPALHVTDANGNIVGPVVNTDTPYNDDVAIIVNGLGLAIPYDQNGFLNDYTDLQLGETVWFTSPDCSGTGMMTVYQVGGQPDNIPLIEMTVGNTAPYVYNEIAYYAQPPFTTQTFNSIEAFADPTQPSISGCEKLDQSQTYLAGTITSFNLGSLNFTPPFSLGD